MDILALIILLGIFIFLIANNMCSQKIIRTYIKNYGSYFSPYRRKNHSIGDIEFCKSDNRYVISFKHFYDKKHYFLRHEYKQK
jgi:hypothetical protein